MSASTSQAGRPGDRRPAGAGPASPLTWPLRLAAFVGWYLVALLRSYASLIADVTTPGSRSTPGFVRLPTRCRSEWEASLLSGLISLTPGTLTMGDRLVDVTDLPGAPEGPGSAWWVLYVHGMFAPDADTLRAELHEMEERMLHGIRPRGVAR
ncbi:Na+/H+ antiporter subunit E [Pseudokineococcus sp. 1T1Z-3]|uniref:Na+/H+ antiporter subunit E n=1 Tax=Pseudokineococcus sp. 1T1Z-3 TaxID=3132745 RepID=UPI0030A40348